LVIRHKAVVGVCELLALLFGLPFGEDLYAGRPVTLVAPAEGGCTGGASNEAGAPPRGAANEGSNERAEPSWSILRAARDHKVFAGALQRGDWANWFVFLAALFGLTLPEGGDPVFQQCTGRTTPSTEPFSEAWLICGRRAGKSFILALIAVFLACFKDWRPALAIGERATVMILAADRKQARVIMRYVNGLLHSVPMFAQLIDSQTKEAIELRNRVTIEIHTASYTKVRGYTVVAALCDEIAFWPTDDAADPDYAVLDAIRPAMATVAGSVLLCASSPYGRRGALFDAWRRYFGKDDAPVLIWQADTRTMNPSVPQRIITESFERDPANAQAEWGAQFRSDVAAFIDRAVVEAAVVPSRHELPPSQKVSYFGFCDPSGGSADSMTLAIAHREGDRGVLDCLREIRPPFSPDEVVKEFADTLKSYGLRRCTSDKYGAAWVEERFKHHGIKLEGAEKTKSAIFLHLLPLLNSHRCDLLDNNRDCPVGRVGAPHITRRTRFHRSPARFS
jgi:hypothetical protein